MPAPERTIGKLVLSVGGRVLRELLIDRKRVTIGRRPYNDLLLDDLTVSGEHAIVHTGPRGESVVHDLQSRNGTLVNGVPVMQQVLAPGDVIDVGIYRIVYRTESLEFDLNDYVPRELPRGPQPRPIDAPTAEPPGGLAARPGAEPQEPTGPGPQAGPTWASYLGKDRSAGGQQGGLPGEQTGSDALSGPSERPAAFPRIIAPSTQREASSPGQVTGQAPGAGPVGSTDSAGLAGSAGSNGPAGVTGPSGSIGSAGSVGSTGSFQPPRVPTPVEPWRFGKVVIRYLGGHDAGREVVMDRPIVSIRNGSGQVAVIARRQGGYYLTHVEGLAYPLVNGESIGLGAHALRDNDLIELAGTILQFCLDGGTS